MEKEILERESVLDELVKDAQENDMGYELPQPQENRNQTVPIPYRVRLWKI